MWEKHHNPMEHKKACFLAQKIDTFLRRIRLTRKDIKIVFCTYGKQGLHPDIEVDEKTDAHIQKTGDLKKYFDRHEISEIYITGQHLFRCCFNNRGASFQELSKIGLKPKFIMDMTNSHEFDVRKADYTNRIEFKLAVQKMSRLTGKPQTTSYRDFLSKV